MKIKIVFGNKFCYATQVEIGKPHMPNSNYILTSGHVEESIQECSLKIIP